MQPRQSSRPRRETDFIPGAKTRSLRGTGITKGQDKQVRPCAVQGLRIGSSSSVMLRLVGHGIVPEKNKAAGNQGRRSFISSAK
jgi:hypothetical protein